MGPKFGPYLFLPTYLISTELKKINLNFWDFIGRMEKQILINVFKLKLINSINWPSSIWGALSTSWFILFSGVSTGKRI